jgi:hypothetical protein
MKVLNFKVSKSQLFPPILLVQENPLPNANAFLLGFLTLEEGTDTLSRNVGKQTPHDTA